MINRWWTFFINELLYNGHLQSLGASSIVYVSSVLLGYPLPISFLIVPYLIFQTIYFHDRYQWFYKDYATNKERSRHLKKYYHILPMLILIVFLFTTVALIYFAAYQVLVFGALIIIFGFLYPLFFKGLTSHIPLFKNFYVAIVFALLVFLPSIYQSGGILVNDQSFALFFFVFIVSMIAQIVLDIKDRQSDKQEGLRTLPVILGEIGVMKVLWTLNLLMFISGFFLWFTVYLRALALLAAATFAINGYSLFSISKNKKEGYILTAGQYLLWPLILVLLANG